MTPAEEFERLRAAWRELGRAVCRAAARRLTGVQLRLGELAGKLEEIGYPQRWLDIRGTRIESLEIDGRQVLPWPYRTEPITPDPNAPPSEHSRTVAPPDPLHVEITAEQVATTVQRLRELGLAGDPPAEQQRADLLAMVRDENEQDTDDEEDRP